MTLYIAGRISGEKGYEAKFAAAEAEVVMMGHTPVSPCNVDHTGATEWAQFMVNDLHAMLDCDGVYALRGWGRSNGATIEVELARQLGKPIVYQA